MTAYEMAHMLDATAASTTPVTDLSGHRVVGVKAHDVMAEMVPDMVGLMYYALGTAPPAGFAGPNDHWHRHSGVCTGAAGAVLFAPDSSVTATQCAHAHGFYMAITGWMVHAWVVPGWESPMGVFSHENPDLPCADGTFHTDAIGRCQGS